MVWEIAAIAAATMVLLHVFYFDRRYATMLKRLEESVVDVDAGTLESASGKENTGEDPRSMMSECVWAVSAIRIKRFSNKLAIFIGMICFIGIALVGAFGSATLGASSFILCLVPAYLFWYHYRNTSERSVRTR